MVISTINGVTRYIANGVVFATMAEAMEYLRGQ